MAPTRKSKLEASVGSSEEEEGSSEEIEESESEEEEEGDEDKTSPPTPAKDKKPSALKKPETTPTSARPQSSSSEDSESDSDSDSQLLRSRRSDPNIKPIASKPMEEPPIATKKARSKPSAASATRVKPGTSAKRPMDSDNNRDTEDSKRAKKKALDGEDAVEEDTAKKTGDDTKKQLFQRLWSEDDEIAVLKGMIEYTAKKGADPVADMNAFHDFIRNKLHIDVSKTQLSDKVRRLKKKYANNASKGKKGGERTFSKPHEQKAYELSKKIWGVEPNGVGDDSTKVNGKEKKNQNQSGRGASSPMPKVDKPSGLDGSKEVSKMEIEQNASPPWLVRRNRSIGDSSVEEEIIRDGLELIEGTKRLDLEEKWKQLQVEEVELYLKRVELIREQTKLVLTALKSSGH